jgi:hypothetical protein
MEPRPGLIAARAAAGFAIRKAIARLVKAWRPFLDAKSVVGLVPAPRA